MSSVKSPNKKKHAYLFLVSRNSYVLEKTLKLIDDYRNDIYIHVDSKCDDWDYDKYNSCVTKSKICYTHQTDCNWAAFSLFNATMILLKNSFNDRYSYYHLMSEACMPIKSQDEIHNELSNSSSDYIYIEKESNFDVQKWSKYYYLLTETPLYRTSNIVKGLSRIAFLLPQRILKINRWKNEKNINGDKIKAVWGWQWFSLTSRTVQLIISKEEFIKKHFKKTHCPDETCIPTILYNFTDMSSVKPSKRNIIFDGKPSIITTDDYERLMSSDDFFARKFDEATDKAIIDKIYERIMAKQNEK